MSRNPKIAPAILELLDAQHSLSAPSIVEALLQDQPSLNKTTVYRALDQLLEKGIICRQMFSDDISVYELRDHHHDHLVCQSCGMVEVVDCLSHLPQQIGAFLVDHHHLTVFGLCEACQKAKVL